jgi:hypothetical protein
MTPVAFPETDAPESMHMAVHTYLCVPQVNGIVFQNKNINLTWSYFISEPLWRWDGVGAQNLSPHLFGLGLLLRLVVEPQEV